MSPPLKWKDEFFDCTNRECFIGYECTKLNSGNFCCPSVNAISHQGFIRGISMKLFIFYYSCLLIILLLLLLLLYSYDGFIVKTKEFAIQCASKTCACVEPMLLFVGVFLILCVFEIIKLCIAKLS